jgi:hypothetical protein
MNNTSAVGGDYSLDKVEPLTHYFGWMVYPIADDGMNKVNLWPYYVCGYTFHILTEVSRRMKDSNLWSDLYHVRDVLEFFLQK